MASADVAKSIAQLANDDAAARRTQIGKAWVAYDGPQPASLKVAPGRADDNVRANLSRLIVQTGVSFLLGAGLEFALGEADAPSPETPEQAKAEPFLKSTWQINRQASKLRELATNGGVCGHLFVRLDDRPWKGSPYPRLIVLDPATVEAEWEAHDYETVVRFKIQTTGSDSKGVSAFRQLIELQDDGTWLIRDEVSPANSTTWTNRVDPERWDYPWPPLVHWQNLPAPNQFWGSADLVPDVIELNYAINGVLSNLRKIVRLHAHPKTVATGLSKEQLAAVAVDPDGMISIPNAEAKLQNLEMLSDLSSLTQLYERLRELLHAISRTPRIEEVPNLSALALAILYQPLTDMTLDKRATYGEGLVELNARILELGGFGPGNVTTLHWAKALPSDPQAQAQTAVIKRSLGVSQETVLAEMGYDAAIEAERRAGEPEMPADTAPVPSGRTGAADAGIPAGDDS